jgi:hypothetical protein
MCGPIFRGSLDVPSPPALALAALAAALAGGVLVASVPARIVLELVPEAELRRVSR